MKDNEATNQQSALGAEGHRFESDRPDQTNQAVTPDGASADPTKTPTETLDWLTFGCLAKAAFTSAVQRLWTQHRTHALTDVQQDHAWAAAARGAIDALLGSLRAELFDILPDGGAFVRLRSGDEIVATLPVRHPFAALAQEVRYLREGHERLDCENRERWAENQRLRHLVHGLLAQAHEPSSSRGNEIVTEMDALGFGGAR